jgi:hypothetical protein
MDATQSSEPDTVRMIQTPDGMRFEKNEPAPASQGTAYIEPEKARNRRELELEAGRKRVAENAAIVAARPPRAISEKELRSQGRSVPVFRPGQAHADRMNTGLGPLLRKVGTHVQAPGG